MAIKDRGLVRIEIHLESNTLVYFENPNYFKTPSGWLYESTFQGVDKYTNARGQSIYVSHVPENQREQLSKPLYG